VIDDDAITDLEGAAARALFYYLPGGLVTRDYTLITFRALSEVFVVNASDVRAADRGSHDSQQDFTVPRFRNGHGPNFDGTVAG
jgi:hypothetical protein